MATGQGKLHCTFMNDLSSPGVVLHVEDNADERESLAAVLKLAGFRSHAADSAGAAIEAAGKLRDELDVLIVDYHLGSRQTGTEVAESVARVLGRSVPTVILTGDPANAEFPMLTNAPIWLVRKPGSPEVLTSALPSLVAFHRAVRGLGETGPR
jgi:CheY-like chemotaxis protein